ncbi:unannotated protein [freshwater metagenome]|uniref:Unannotated protein n=1 Tax=freshwater metagenome TaxID=449393 RepID=A0A6J6MBG7_9ZZZZ
MTFALWPSSGSGFTFSFASGSAIAFTSSFVSGSKFAFTSGRTSGRSSDLISGSTSGITSGCVITSSCNKPDSTCDSVDDVKKGSSAAKVNSLSFVVSEICSICCDDSKSENFATSGRKLSKVSSSNFSRSKSTTLCNDSSTTPSGMACFRSPAASSNSVKSPITSLAANRARSNADINRSRSRTNCSICCFASSRRRASSVNIFSLYARASFIISRPCCLASSISDSLSSKASLRRRSFSISASSRNLATSEVASRTNLSAVSAARMRICCAASRATDKTRAVSSPSNVVTVASSRTPGSDNPRVCIARISLSKNLSRS